jgi:muconolactone delta-isomerase
MRFFVETKFKQAPTDEILGLIPAEIARGRELDAQGLRLQLLVAADRSSAWQVYQADSLATIQQAIESLPLHPFVTSTITPLADATEFA